MGHTPGPWWIEEPDDPAEDDRQISDGFGNTATVYGDAETATAHASLIAAAPELLSLLRRMVQYVNEYPTGGYHMNDVLRDCRAAIAKAEGRSE